MKHAFFEDGPDTINIPRIERVLHMILLIFLAFSIEIAMFDTEALVVFFLTRGESNLKLDMARATKEFSGDNGIAKKF